ncbi:MAG TPA: choice-of-anchor D domain-containing protein [Terriglobales bacterium]|nr:choice-of-anchor D domain-containing protein [Terriglobales bacterium]
MVWLAGPVCRAQGPVNPVSAPVNGPAPGAQFTVTFSFTGSVTLASSTAAAVAVLTQGSRGKDFTQDAISPGSCTGGSNYLNGQSCTVTVDFNPRYPGQRQGAVELISSSGAIVQTTYIEGLGSGGQVTYPLTASRVSYGPPDFFGNIEADPITGLATDGTNVYFVMNGSATWPGPGATADFLALCGAPIANRSAVTCTGPANSPSFPDNTFVSARYSVAMDGAGNIYAVGTASHVAWTSGASPVGVSDLFKFSNAGGAITSLNMSAVTSTEFGSNPLSENNGQSIAVPDFGLLAVDGGGNVYALETIEEYFPYPAAVIDKFSPSGVETYAFVPSTNNGESPNETNIAGGLACDAAGNLYFLEFDASAAQFRIARRDAATGVISTYLDDNALLGGPLALDAAGDVYAVGQNFSVQSGTTVSEFLATNGTVASTPAASYTMPQPAFAIEGLAVAAYGDVLTADRQAGALDLLSAGNATLAFGSQAVNGSQKAQQLSLTNIGSAPLQFSSYQIGDAEYQSAPGDSCRKQPVVAGGTCTLALNFLPTTTGPHNSTVQPLFTGAAAAAAAINLTGAGVAASRLVAVSVNGAAGSSGSGPANGPYSLVVEATDAGGNPLAGVGVTAVPGQAAGGESALCSSCSAVTGNDGLATLALDANSVARGQAFSVAITTTTPGITATPTFSLTNLPGAAAQLVFTTEPPAAVVAGTAISVTVAEQDAFGNPEVADNSTTVTLSLTAGQNPGGDTLHGTVAGTLSGGSITLSPSVNLAGAGYAMSATAGAITATSTSFAVSAAALNAVRAAAGNSQSAIATLPFAAPLEAIATDAFGNPISGVVVNFTVNWGSAGAGANLSAPSAITNSAGFASIIASGDGTAGSFTVTASASGAVSSGVFTLNNQFGAGIGSSSSFPLTITTNGSGLSSITFTSEGTSVPDFTEDPADASTFNPFGCARYLADHGTGLAICNMNIVFSPQAAGLRRGELTIVSQSGGVFHMFLSGEGVGPVLASAGAIAATALPSGASSVVVDPAGVVFSTSGTSVYKNGSIFASVNFTGNGTDRLAGISIDGGGNLYFADLTDGHLGALFAGASTAADITPSGFNGAAATYTDGNGNLFVYDTAAAEIYELANPSVSPGGSATDVADLARTTGFNQPQQITGDSSGNLYVADPAARDVYEIPAGSWSGSGPATSVTVLANANNGLALPSGVALEPDRDLLVADQASRTVERIPNASTPPAICCTPLATVLAASLSQPGNITVGSSGSLYIADSAGIVELDRTGLALPAMMLSDDQVAAGAAAGEASVPVANIGLVDATGVAAAVSGSDFELSGVHTCGSAPAPVTMAPRGGCVFAIQILPLATSLGAHQATLSLASNAQPMTGSITANVSAGAAAAISAGVGTPQTAVVATAFANPLTVTVNDAFGNPLSGATVTFTVVAGSGGAAAILSAGSATTNSSGQASVTAIGNTAVGGYTVTASVSGIATPASFSLTNTVGVASALTASGGTPQSAVAAAAFGAPLSVTVNDAFGNPVSGATVSFALLPSTSGARATLSAGTAVTSANGVASVTATANTVAGAYSVTATVSGITTPATFALSNTAGPAAALTITGGTPQSAAAAAAFAAPLNVTVDDAFGNPVSGATVAFTVASGANGARATLSAASATTNGSGVASVTATANTVAGVYSIIATVSGIAPASFTLTNTAGTAAALTATGGTPQSSVAAAAFGAPLSVTVNDAFGNPVSGATVAFAVAPGAGGARATLSALSATTNGSGVASVAATANTVAGAYSITAAVSGIATPASFTLTNTAGTAAALTATGGTPQSSVAAAAFGTPLSVTVDDAFGNPVSGATVTFTAVPGSSGARATLSALSATTNGSGIASVAATANTVAGAYSITAAVSGIATPASFTLTNTAGTAAALTASGGTPQSAVAAAAFGTPLSVTVNDAFGNPVSGAIVAFAVAPSAGGARATLSALSATTNRSGVASVAATANTIAGAYLITAAVSGIATPASFTLTNTAGTAAALTASGGTPQSAVAAAAFGSPLSVTVADAFGNPVSGATVTFTAVPGSNGARATLSALSATTNGSGVASVTATANTVAGAYSVTATVSGIATPASFALTNTAGAVAALTASSGTPQSAVAAAAFATPLSVTVNDAFGNPVSGATVAFAVAPGTGGARATLSALSATTNGSGVASVTATANTVAGSYSVAAAVSGIAAPASFTLTNTAGTAAALTATAGTPQFAVAAAAFGSPLSVTVNDAFGNPVSGATVAFTVAPGAGGARATLSALSATTNGSGVASVTATANTVAGAYSVAAMVSGIATPASFALTNTASTAAALTATGGTLQSAVAAAAFGSPLSVTVADAFGNPVSGATVAFTVAPGANGARAALSSLSATTNGSGIASVTATANTVAGSYSVAAMVSGIATPASFALTNTAGAASALTASGGTPQSAVAAAAFGAPLSVTVDDAFGNPVSGATVTFTAVPGSNGARATLSAVSATTNGSGVASVTATANTVAGVYSIIATVSGIVAPASFTLTNAPGGAATLVAAGLGSSFTAGAPISITVKVEDSFGNIEASDSTSTVALSLSGGPGGAVLTGSTQQTLQAGAATFSIAIDTAGSGYLLSLSSSGGLRMTGQSFVISAAAAASLLVTAPPSATAGSVAAIGVAARDRFGNTATSYSGTVHFTSSDPAALLPANIALVDGADVVGATFGTSGTQTVTATDIGNSAINGTSGKVSVAPPPTSLSADRPSLNFASQPISAPSAAETVVISNTGTATATLGSIVLSGANGTDFSWSSACGTMLAAGAQCPISVVFTPSVTGGRAAVLTVNSSAVNSPATVALAGIGVSPGVLLGPEAIHFGSVPLNTDSAALPVTITNSGDAALTISNAAVSPGFELAGSCVSVQPGSSCTFGIVFAPTAMGPATGMLTLTDNSGGGSQTLPLDGSGIAAGISISPTVLTFPPSLVGSTSYAQTLTITNTGTATLTGLTLPATAGDFTITTTGASACGATLTAGASCAAAIAVKPSVEGADAATVTIADSLGEQAVPMTATGIVPGALVSSTSLSFGSQALHTSSGAQTVTLTNRGSASLNVSGVTVSPAAYAENDNCGGALAAGAACAINVTFTPTATGAVTGALTVADSAANSPQTVMLAGAGVAELLLAPSTLDFGSALVGSASPQQTVNVTNMGTAAVTLEAQLAGDFAIGSNLCTAALAPGASCQLLVDYEPHTLGQETGSLTLSDGSGTNQATASLMGRGISAGIGAAPAVISFGSEPMGADSPAQTLTITNSGEGPLTIQAITALGDFRVAGTTCLGASAAAAALAGGATCVVSVSMQPSTPGSRTGSLQIFNSANGELDVALSGVGQGADASLVPSQLSFGSQPIAAANVTLAGQPQAVTVTNTGNVALAIAAISVQGGFTQINNCGSSLAVGSTCNISVSFVPTALGQWTGTLTVSDSSAASPRQVVELNGFGSPNGVIMAPAVLRFGNLTVGQTSAPQTAEIINSSGQTINGLTLTASGEFTETSTCGDSLASGATCTVSVTVTPQVFGDVTGAIAISGSLAGSAALVRSSGSRWLSGNKVNRTDSTDSSAVMAEIALRGSLGQPAPQLNVASLSFTPTGVGQSSAVQNVTITNSSANPLDIGSIAATGDFTAASACGSWLRPGASCAVMVGFRPTVAGDRTGGLNIVDAAGSQAVILSGIGSDFTVAAPSGSPAITVNAGDSGSTTISFASVAGDSQKLALECSRIAPNDGNGTLSCYFQPSTVTIAGGSSATSVLIVTTQAGGASPVAPGAGLSPWLLAATAPLFALWIIAADAETRRRRWKLALLCGAMAFGGACAQSLIPPHALGTPGGSYQETLSVTSSTGVTHTTTVTILVK